MVHNSCLREWMNHLVTLFTGITPHSKLRAPMANQLSKALRPISISRERSKGSRSLCERRNVFTNLFFGDGLPIMTSRWEMISYSKRSPYLYSRWHVYCHIAKVWLLNLNSSGVWGLQSISKSKP
jgi:hypothetical protein